MAGCPKPVDVELTILSARDLKNVNWRYGGLRPHAVAWVDPEHKVSTRVDPEGDTNPSWDEKITIPVVNRPLQDAELIIEIVHEKPSELTKPLVATARIPLAQVLYEVGFDERLESTLKLKRPSTRPQGQLDILIRLREKQWPGPQYSQSYGTRGYPSPQYPYANPPAGYPYPYEQPNPYPGSNPKSYGGSYCNEVPSVGSSLGPYSAGSAPPASYDAEAEEPKSSEFGLGTRLAVGVVAGFVEGLTSDFDDAEDNIEDRTVGSVAGFWGGLVSDVIDHAEDKIADRTVGAVAGFVEDFVSDDIDDAEDEIEDITVGAVAGFVKGLVSDVIDHAEDEIEDTAAERVEDNLGYDHGNSGEDDYGNVNGSEDDHGNGGEDDHGNVNGSEDDHGNGGEDDHGNGNGSEDDHGNGTEDDHGNGDDDY
jgi:hypothetical protein